MPRGKYVRKSKRAPWGSKTRHGKPVSPEKTAHSPEVRKQEALHKRILRVVEPEKPGITSGMGKLQDESMSKHANTPLETAKAVLGEVFDADCARILGADERPSSRDLLRLTRQAKALEELENSTVREH